MRRHSYAAAALFVIAAAWPALAQEEAPIAEATRPRVIQAPGAPAEGPYVDPMSHLTFPVSVGDFHRFRVSRGPTRYDVDAGYALVTPDARLSVSVFISLPPPYIPVALASCTRIADDRKLSLNSFADVVVSENKTVAPVTGYAGVEGRSFTGTFTTSGGTRMTTDTYIYCGLDETWVVQYSFSSLAGTNTAALEAEFIRNFKWTVPHTPPK